MRLILGDQVGFAAQQVSQLRHEPAAFGFSVEAVAGKRFSADLHLGSIREHDLQTDNMPSRRAMLQPMASASVDTNDAAHGGHTAHGRIWAKLPTEGT